MPAIIEAGRMRPLVRGVALGVTGSVAVAGAWKIKENSNGLVNPKLAEIQGSFEPSQEVVFSLGSLAARVCRAEASNYKQCYQDIVDPPQSVHIQAASPPVLIASPPSSTTTTEAVVASGASGLPPLLFRIGGCESNGNPNGPIIYTAQNKYNPAATGGFEDLDSTWNNYDGYKRAMDAPPSVQNAFNIALFNSEGTRPWVSSESCWG